MAYGARLESVLGESPRGFESPILRGRQSSRRDEQSMELRPISEWFGPNSPVGEG